MHYGQSIYLPVPILVEPILVSAAVSRHASDGNNLAPKPPPPTILIVGNASKVISLFNTRAPITKPVSGSIVASAIPNSPFTYKSGELYSEVIPSGTEILVVHEGWEEDYSSDREEKRDAPIFTIGGGGKYHGYKIFPVHTPEESSRENESELLLVPS